MSVVDTTALTDSKKSENFLSEERQTNEDIEMKDLSERK